jgi:nucleoside-diphosphate-sugar epimerase
MPRILIAGCGYVGKATALLFRESGWEVEGWTHSGDSAEKLSSLPVVVRAVDIADRDQVYSAAANKFDRIIHCASSAGGDASEYRRVYLDGARNLLDVFAGTPLLFTSSTSVYAQRDGSWVTERDLAEPIHESGRILRETEELILDRRGVVARLAGIYGPGRSFLLQQLLAGEAVMDPERDRFLNQVHRDDIAVALFLLAQRGAAEIYNVVDDQPILVSECYDWLTGELHLPKPPTGVASKSRKRGNSNKRVSNKKLRALGWRPKYETFQKAMRESILPAKNAVTVDCRNYKPV